MHLNYLTTTSSKSSLKSSSSKQKKSYRMIKQKATKIEPKPANKEYILKNRFKLQNLVILIFKFIFSSSPKNTENTKEMGKYFVSQMYTYKPIKIII